MLYRMVIKLRYTSANLSMLNLIKQHVAGSVRVDERNGDVIWAVNHKTDILKVCKILDMYPVLTSRRKLQYDFLLNCLSRSEESASKVTSAVTSDSKEAGSPQMAWFFRERANKYDRQEQVINEMQQVDITKLPYFNAWLSGFVEAQGCFIIKGSNHHSFSIAQKYDSYIIQAIKDHFGLSNKLRFTEKQGGVYVALPRGDEIELRVIQFQGRFARKTAPYVAPPRVRGKTWLCHVCGEKHVFRRTAYSFSPHLVEAYCKESLRRIHRHFDTYTLLGEKHESKVKQAKLLGL